MLYKFERFLVVKVAERVQMMSREKCKGCVNGLILDQLHSCMQVSLAEKMELFLPRAKTDALNRLESLFFIYQQTAWVDDEQAHLEIGANFIELLQPYDLLDRRYINEDSVIDHPFNTSWLTDQLPSSNSLPPLLPLDLGVTNLPPLLPLDPAATNQQITPTKKRKRNKK
jgi:hypothetical protein